MEDVFIDKGANFFKYHNYLLTVLSCCHGWKTTEEFLSMNENGDPENRQNSRLKTSLRIKQRTDGHSFLKMQKRFDKMLRKPFL